MCKAARFCHDVKTSILGNPVLIHLTLQKHIDPRLKITLWCLFVIDCLIRHWIAAAQKAALDGRVTHLQIIYTNMPKHAGAPCRPAVWLAASDWSSVRMCCRSLLVCVRVAAAWCGSPNRNLAGWALHAWPEITCSLHFKAGVSVLIRYSSSSLTIRCLFFY